MIFRGEEELIEANLIKFSLTEEGKKAKFLEVWGQAKQVMAEKLKFQQSLLEILVRSVAFIVRCSSADGELQQENEMINFMQIDVTNKSPTLPNATAHVKKLFDFKTQDRFLNINDFIKNIKKINESLHNDQEFNVVTEIVKDFSFSNALFNKCEDLLNLFFNTQSAYYLSVKKLIWTFYIFSRKRLLNNSRNLLESLPMLLSLISLVLVEIDNKRFSYDLISSLEKETNQTSGDLFKQKKREMILQKLMKRTSDHLEVQTIEKMKTQFVTSLTAEKEVQHFFAFDILEDTEMMFNFSLENESSVIELIEIFKNLYAKQLKYKHFDERIFLINNNTSDCSPVKLTPFKRQKVLSSSEAFMDKKPKNNSFRKIEFEEKDPTLSNTEKTNSGNNFNMLSSANNLFKGIDIRELSKKINESVKMTPCTRVIFMDKWVKEYIKNWSNEKLLKYETDSNIFTLISENLHKIQKLFEAYHVKIMTSIDEIEKLIIKLIYGLLNRDERIFRKEFVSRLLKNTNFLKSAIVVGVEIVLFIENVEYICFYKLANALELDLYEFWKIINPFTRFDLTVPSDLRLHFQEIELQLWSFMIWKKPSQNFKEEASEFLKDYTSCAYDKEIKCIQDMEFNNQSLFVYQDKAIFEEEDFLDLITPPENTSKSINTLSSTVMASPLSTNLKAYKFLRPMSIFLRRILNYVIFSNKKISDNLHLTTEAAKECEVLFKSIITDKNFFDVLYNKHIDQVIVCCIMAVLKHRKIYEQKDFKAILEAYQKSKSDDSEGNMKSLFYNIKVNSHHMDIVEFYNECFIKKVDALVKNVCEDEESEQLRSRKRKLSVPETEMRKLQFESETAFEKETIMYEPLKKTVFNENSSIGTPHLLMSKNVPMSYSARCSPMISKSLYTSPAMNRTPRTKVVKDLYSDYISSETLVMSAQREQGGSNIFKKKIKDQLSSGKMKLNKFDAQSPINSIIESPSLSFSQQSESFFAEVNTSNSQSTPEFNKVKK